MSGDYGVGDLIPLEDLKGVSNHIQTKKLYNFTIPSDEYYYKVYSVDRNTVLLVTGDAVTKADISNDSYDVIWTKSIPYGKGGVYSKKYNIFATTTQGIDVSTGGVVWSITSPSATHTMEIVGEQDSFMRLNMNYQSEFLDEINIANGQKIKSWSNVKPVGTQSLYINKLIRVNDYLVAIVRSNSKGYVQVYDSNGDFVKSELFTNSPYMLTEIGYGSIYQNTFIYDTGNNRYPMKLCYQVPSLTSKSLPFAKYFEKDNKTFASGLSKNNYPNFDKYKINSIDSYDTVFELTPEITENIHGQYYDIDEDGNVVMVGYQNLVTDIALYKIYQYLEIEN